MEFVKLISQG